MSRVRVSIRWSEHASRLAVIALALLYSAARAAPEGLEETAWFDSPFVLAPRGAPAERIADLWWFMFWIGAVVFLSVVTLMVIAVARRGGGESLSRIRNVVLMGLVLTTLTIGVTLYFSIRTLSALSAPLADDVLTFEIVGHGWWWEIRYEGEEITANELHIPVGRPVRLLLTSADVIHSFWVPRLSGKTDLIPGQVNVHRLEADVPGVYRGQCAELCGVQHAHMAFLVIAEPVEQFDDWLERMRAPAVAIEGELATRGEQVFFAQGCVNCHSVRGRQITGDFGPDLTHLASRLTIGAGLRRRTPGNLAGWIANSQALKPGNFMPPQRVPPGDLPALLAYLESLE